MPGLYNTEKNYEKNRKRVIALVEDLGLTTNADDMEIYDFVMDDTSPNKDIYMDMARAYFNSKFTIQQENVKVQGYFRRFVDFMPN